MRLLFFYVSVLLNVLCKSVSNKKDKCCFANFLSISFEIIQFSNLYYSFNNADSTTVKATEQEHVGFPIDVMYL